MKQTMFEIFIKASLARQEGSQEYVYNLSIIGFQQISNI